MNWFINNIIGMLGIIISIFIAYHIFYLSKKISFTNKIKHAQKIRESIEKLIAINVLAPKVEIINVKKYFKDYPFRNSKNKHGYTYLGAELKQARFDGVEFFCGVEEVYYDSDKKYSLFKKEGYEKCEENVLKTGIIPYDWIKYIYIDGVSTGYRPQFFVNFNGKNKEPYKYFAYYMRGDDFKIVNFREIIIN